MGRVGGVVWRAVVLAVVMTPLAVVPLVTFLIGATTFGADRGWWVGEATWDDGEGTWAFAVGGALMVGVVVLGWALGRALTTGRRRDLPWVLLMGCLAPALTWMAVTAT